MDDEEQTLPSSSRQQAPASTSYPLDTPADDVLGLLDEHASDFELLKRALLNERMAPELLAFKGDLVGRIRAGLARQVADLEVMEGRRDAELPRCLLGVESDRLRFLLKAYLRARLAKIQASAGAVLDSAELRARLSPAEASFASGFFVALGRLMRGAVLDELPPHYQSLVKRYEAEEGRRLLDCPDLARYVFCHVLQDCGQVPDGPDGQTAEMRAGDMMVAKYTTVAHLVHAGQVCLL